MKLDATDFELFDLPPTFAQDRAVLDARWKDLQREAHPDRFAAQGATAQRVAMQWSVRINEAYQRLKDPVKRAAYLCTLGGAPIDAEHTDVRLHFSMKRLPDAAATRAISEINDRITNEQFRQDVPIWENRSYLEKPRLTEIDGPVAQYRRWFSQFYSGWQPGKEERA